MDPLTITQAVCALTVVGKKVSIGLFQFTADVKSAPTELKNLGDELVALCAVLGNLERSTRAQESSVLGSEGEDLLEILRQCMEAVREIDKVVDHYRKAAKRGIFGRTLGQMVQNIREDDVKSLRSRLEGFKSLLTIALMVSDRSATEQVLEQISVVTKLLKVREEAGRVKGSDSSCNSLIRSCVSDVSSLLSSRAPSVQVSRAASRVKHRRQARIMQDAPAAPCPETIEGVYEYLSLGPSDPFDGEEDMLLHKDQGVQHLKRWELEACESSLKRALTVARAVDLPDSQVKYDITHLLGDCFRKQRRHEDAVPLLRLSLAGSAATRSKNDQSVLECRLTLAATYQDLGRTEESSELLERVLRAQADRGESFLIQMQQMNARILSAGLLRTRLRSNQSTDIIASLNGYLDETVKQWAINHFSSFGLDPLAKNDAEVGLLHIACLSGSAVLVTACLQRGFDPRAVTAAGETPLHYCSQVDIASLLMGSGLNPYQSDNQGRTAVAAAAISGFKEVVKFYLEQEYDFDTRKDNLKCLHVCQNTIILELFINNGRAKDLNGSPASSVRPLHTQVYHGNLDVVSALLERGANVNELDRDGRTPLHWALCVSRDIFARNLEKSLPAYDALPLEGRLRAHAWSKQLMHWTFRKQLVDHGAPSLWDEIVQCLIDHGADITLSDPKGWTALHFAAANGNDFMVRNLIRGGLGLNEETQDGRTPLTIAMSAGHVSTADILAGLGGRRSSRYPQLPNLSSLPDNGPSLQRHRLYNGLERNQHWAHGYFLG